MSLFHCRCSECASTLEERPHPVSPHIARVHRQRLEHECNHELPNSDVPSLVFQSPPNIVERSWNPNPTLQSAGTRWPCVPVVRSPKHPEEWAPATLKYRSTITARA
uniref:Uncharacterized protein n=1 Tax=Spongospora subterranea TaxID=70186 RepID=A0A0H5QW17_9EUKA|eukprot:CRZ06188.1 hypothetical protein [Spongospora subterranea]